MPAVRANPNRIKRHRSYTAGELAHCFGVHKNTVRHWRQHGLAPIDGNRGRDRQARPRALPR